MARLMRNAGGETDFRDLAQIHYGDLMADEFDHPQAHCRIITYALTTKILHIVQEILHKKEIYSDIFLFCHPV